MFKEELLIIRHARSKYNLRLSDDLDDSITDWGVKQAETVGKYLVNHFQHHQFHLFTSPFLRCLQTAKIIQTYLRQKDYEGWSALEPTFKINTFLREYVNHSGKSVHVKDRSREYNRFDWKGFPSEGTTFAEEWNETFLARMHNCHQQLPNKSIVITHGLPALMLLNIATGIYQQVPIWDHSLDNCSMTYIKQGRIIWRGRNLYSECDDDPMARRKAYDELP